MNRFGRKGAALGRSRERESGRARWMQHFKERAVALGAHPGQIDWATADYLYSTGIGPYEAAEKKYRP